MVNRIERIETIERKARWIRNYRRVPSVAVRLERHREAERIAIKSERRLAKRLAELNRALPSTDKDWPTVYVGRGRI